jgi:hypothetical protein
VFTLPAATLLLHHQQQQQQQPSWQQKQQQPCHRLKGNATLPTATSAGTTEQLNWLP